MTGGERWAASELGALRAGRFVPRAWWRFLRASFARSASAREARPELTSQARGWSAVGLGAGVALYAWPRIRTPRAGQFALWWLATAAMLDWHLGMLEGPDGEHRERLSAADALTLLRIWSVPLIAAQSSPAPFAALIAAAGASDALDGALARRTGPSRLGRDLDTVADALTSAAAARAGRRAGWLPANAARLVTLRSVVPITVVAATYFRTGQRPPDDAFGATRRLAPILLSGFAASPFAPRTGAALIGCASIGSLALASHLTSAASGGKSAARRPGLQASGGHRSRRPVSVSETSDTLHQDSLISR